MPGLMLRTASLIGLFLFAAQAFAHGGIGAMSGLLSALLVFIAVVGLPILAAMIAVLRRRQDGAEAGIKTRVLVIVAVLYVLFALFFYAIAMDSESAKIPGVVVSCLVATLFVYCARERRSLVKPVVTVIGLVTLIMLLVPAGFWKGNAIDLVGTTFVDNSAELGLLHVEEFEGSGRALFRLDDGRRILQFEFAGAAAPGDLYSYDPAKVVSLRTIDTGRGGQWFDITHYEETRAYQQSRRWGGYPARHILFRRSVDMYREKERHSIGVVVDKHAAIDYRTILLHTLSWSGVAALKELLVDAGNIDVNDPEIINVAFKNTDRETYLVLVRHGLDENAIDSKQRTLLHRVAFAGDVNLMRYLTDQGASLSATDSDGLTPVQVFYERFASQPHKIDEFRTAFSTIDPG